MPRGNNNKKTWLNITDGRIRESGKHIDENTPGATFREGEDLDGKHFEKWEIVNDFVEGFITDISITDDDKFGRRLEIVMNDMEEEFTVRTGWDSRYAGSFLQRAPGIDFKQMVKIVPWYRKSEKKTGVMVIQGVEKIESYYTKEDPKGSPVFPSFPEGGKPNKDELAQWKLDMSKFQQLQIIEVLLPAIAAADPMSTAAMRNPGDASDENPFVDEETGEVSDAPEQRKAPGLNTENIPPENDPDNLPF